MIEEILSFLNERRKMKNVSTERYQDLDQMIKRKCSKKKEEGLNLMRREIEINEERD